MPKSTTEVSVESLLAGLVASTAADDVDSRILSTAAHLVLAEGIDALEVDRVAELADVGRSTIYRRFENRNSLLAAALAHEGQRFFAALVESVASIDDPTERVVAGFCVGLRFQEASGLARLIRAEPLLLRLLTVDAGPLVEVATRQLVAAAAAETPGIDRPAVANVAELLVRLAISFVVTSGSALPLDDEHREETVRRHIAPLLGPVLG